MSEHPQSPAWTYRVGQTYLKRAGWTIAGEVPNAPKAVLVAAPHSSNWDLPFMLAVGWSFRLSINWLGKHTLFEGPGGAAMRALGGIPVDRRAKNGVVQQISERFNTAEKLYLAVAPSGTRKGHTRWKSGFYHIALQAEVPIVLGFLDYRRKVGGLGPSIIPSGDIKADMDRIREFYSDIVGHDGSVAKNIYLPEEASAEPDQTLLKTGS